MIVELVTSKGKVQRLKEIVCCKCARKHRGVQSSHKNLTLRGWLKNELLKNSPTLEEFATESGKLKSQDGTCLGSR